MAGNDIAQLPGLTMNFSTPVFAASGGATTLGTTNAIFYCIDGKAYTHAQMSGHANVTTDVNTGAAFVGLTGTATTGQACVFILALAANGDLKVAQGPVLSTDASGNGTAEPYGLAIPYIDTGLYCPVAIVVAKHYGQASTWTYGSSNWNTSGYNGTIADLATLPTRPVAI